MVVLTVFEQRYLPLINESGEPAVELLQQDRELEGAKLQLVADLGDPFDDDAEFQIWLWVSLCHQGGVVGAVVQIIIEQPV